MRKYLLILSSLSLLFITSCEKPEKKWPAVKIPVGIQTETFGLGENYENQIWFNIQDQKSWVNHHGVWDIAFASGSDNQIILNGGKNLLFSVAKIPAVPFNYINIDVSKLRWDFDNPSGKADSMVFNNWFTQVNVNEYKGTNNLYVLDLGEDSLSLKKKRYVKLQLLSRIGGVYHFSWGYLLDTLPTHDVYLPSNPTKNYTYYNFLMADTVENEPTRNDNWDLVFTTYKRYIPDPQTAVPTPYIVRGVLSNKNGVQVYEVPNVGLNTWDQINLAYAKSINYSPWLDEIGYDWKIWNMSANKYTMANKIYVVKDTRDNYFKLKFVDFYDDNGRKGYPKMAWELLK